MADTTLQSEGTSFHKSQRIAVVLVRGMVDVTTPVKDTLAMLRLHRKNYCVVLPNTAVVQGMLHKVKDYVTWGLISDDVYAKLMAARGEEWKARESDSKGTYVYGYLEINGKKYKPYFRLNPPRKGFGRKGIKVSFKAGGALGDRSEKMDDLIQRML